VGIGVDAFGIQLVNVMDDSYELIHFTLSSSQNARVFLLFENFIKI